MIIAIFNPSSNVGKTSLVYHLAWMFRDLGLEVIAADFDPQAQLSATFLNEDELEERWLIEPNRVFKGIFPEPYEIEEQLSLLCGTMSLFGFEDELSKAWYEHSDEMIAAFWNGLQAQKADIVLMDLGSNLGAINRAALISADYVIVPLIPDLLSVQGLKQFGAIRQKWRSDWQARYKINPNLPKGEMQALGYVIFEQPILLYLGTNNYSKWLMQISKVYHQAIKAEETRLSLKEDPQCLTIFKSYHSVIRIAEEARKPIFHLKPADGAMGAYGEIIPSAYRQYQQLALNLAKGAGLADALGEIYFK